MAVTLDSQPTANSTLGDCNIFELTLSSGGDDTEVNELAYQLQDASGTPLNDIDYVPYTGSSFKLDIRKDLERRMVCKPPTTTLGDLDIEGDAEYWGLLNEYKLAYGERVTALEACDAVTTLDTTTSTKKIFNGYKTGFNWYAQGVMSNRPLTNEVYSFQDDWIVFNAFYAAVTYTVTAYNSTGTVTGTGFVTKAAGVHFLGVGPRNLMVDVGLTPYAYYTVNVNDGADLGTYTFILKNCQQKQFREIIWKEPLGGWSSVGFEIFGLGNQEENQTAANLKHPCSYFSNDEFFHTGKLVSSQTRTTVTLSKNLPLYENTDLFLNGLFASNNVYLAQWYGASKTWRRVNILNKSSEPISENEVNLTITVELSMESFANAAS